MSAFAGRLQLGGWRWVFLLLMAGGSVASYLAARYGLRVTTNLGDVIPWGLCLGLNVFCGIAVAAGALTVASIAAVIGGTEWRIIARASLLIGCIGYLMAMLGMIANGPTDTNWRILFQRWTQRSILVGGAWTVLILALLLFIEFAPQYSVRITRSRWFNILQRIDLSLLILATVLAVVHQFGLDRLIKIAEARFSPLWSGPSLSLAFYLSSLSLAFAVLLFASWRSLLAFGRALPSPVLPVIARALTVGVFVYLVIRLMDLMERHLLFSMFSITREGLLLLLEIVLLLVGMVWIKGSEGDSRELYFGAALIIAGVVANRLNTAITALEVGAGQDYLPRWGEFLISYSLVAAGVAGFALGIKHLSVFPRSSPRTAKGDRMAATEERWN